MLGQKLAAGPKPKFTLASDIQCAAARTALHKHYVQHAMIPSFHHLYKFGRTIGHISVIAAGGLLAGGRGAILAATAELLTHAWRFTPLNMGLGIKQERTNCIDRNWVALETAPVTQNITGRFACTPTMIHKPHFTAIELPPGVRGDFMRTAVALGIRHTGLSPALSAARRITSTVDEASRNIMNYRPKKLPFGLKRNPG